MAESNGDASPLDSLYAGLHPNSLSDGHKGQILKLTGANTFTIERGPRYNEYSVLRDKKLRMKRLKFQKSPEKERDGTLQNRSVLSLLTPQKKKVIFNCQASPGFTTPPKRPKRSSTLTQSVPDFSSILRKENRKPSVVLSPVVERSVTLPTGLLKSGRIYSKVGRGSTPPTNSAEKRSGRKSYAIFDEMKGSAAAAAASNAIINGENRGGRTRRGTGRSVSGYRML